MNAPALRLANLDPRMREIVETVGPYRLRIHEDGWYVLASSIVHQQVSGVVAANIVRRLALLNGGIFPTPTEFARIDSPQLRGLGLTERKAATLSRIAAAISRGELRLSELASANDDEVAEVLCALPGVGPWTAQMVLVFHLGREDVLMPGDVGLRKAIAGLYGMDVLPSEKETFSRGEQWRPLRTVASWYLWKSLPNFPEPGFAPYAKPG